MKIYKCNSCGITIENPHKVKMKEFYLAVDIDNCGIFPTPWKRKTKIHLCEHCFEGLYVIVKRIAAQMVQTNDVLIRNGKKYEVIIADENIFVICPVTYDKKEKSEIVNYTKAEVYSNSIDINTLEELGFKKR